jgi:hypothetical protein
VNSRAYKTQEYKAYAGWEALIPLLDSIVYNLSRALQGPLPGIAGQVGGQAQNKTDPIYYYYEEVKNIINPKSWTEPPPVAARGTVPKSSGSSGNCNWDGNGNFCWNSTACGGRCRGCISGHQGVTDAYGCARARSYFINNANRCPSCGGASGGGQVKAGSSGNCKWDANGGWCWSSSACGGPCRGCISNYHTNNTSQGCSRARSYFIANSRRCSSCGQKISAGSSGNCKWDGHGGWCWSSTACNGPCRACVSNYNTTNPSAGCGRARQYFLDNSRRCSSCQSPYMPSAGRSGNCNWDTKGAFCWNSTACGGRCRACIQNYKTHSANAGCSRARSYFLNNYKKCSSCDESPTKSGGIGSSSGSTSSCPTKVYNSNCAGNCRQTCWHSKATINGVLRAVDVCTGSGYNCSAARSAFCRKYHC